MRETKIFMVTLTKLSCFPIFVAKSKYVQS